MSSATIEQQLDVLYDTPIDDRAYRLTVTRISCQLAQLAVRQQQSGLLLLERYVTLADPASAPSTAEILTWQTAALNVIDEHIERAA